jgi:hypothetical protein
MPLIWYALGGVSTSIKPERALRGVRESVMSGAGRPQPSYCRHGWHSLGPLFGWFVRIAEIYRPTREIKMKDAHNKAAEHHESAAKSHRAAAESHGKNDHAKGKEHATQAQQHAQNAGDHSKTAHAKSEQQK